MKVILLILVFSLVSIATEKEDCKEIIEYKTNLYDFKPTDLSREEQLEKGKELDKFWEMVKSNGELGMDCLADLIENEEQDGYFSYDAAKLLYSLDTNKKYTSTIISGINKCDLTQVVNLDYLRMALKLKSEGNDISNLSKKFIIECQDKITLRDHFFTLDKFMIGIILFGSIEDEIATKVIIDILENENVNSDLEEKLVTLLYVIHTQKGKDYVKNLEKVNKLSKELLESINKLENSPLLDLEAENENTYEEIITKLSWVPFNFEKKWYGASSDKDFIISASKKLEKKDLPKVREARRKTIFNISDEIFYEYYTLTSLIISLESKN